MRPSPIRPPSLLRALLAAAFALALTAAPAAASLGPDAAHSPNAEDVRTAYWVMLGVATLLIAGALAAIAAAVARFRETGAAEPRRLTAGRGVIARVVAPLAALAVAIFVFGVVMTESARDVEPSGPDEGAPLEIDVVGQQWLWRFGYPVSEREEFDTVFSYNELVVPVDTAVILNIDSTDVLHRWFVPELGGQVEAVPGEIARTWFKADEEGVYPGRSTLFSGISYPAMRSWVRAVPAPEYEAYVSQLADDIAEAQAEVQSTVDSAATPEAGQ